METAMNGLKARNGEEGETASRNVMTPALTAVFAIAAGLAVGNLYWAQPLLAQITADFGVSTAQGGMLITATQIGYAIGILLIVPLGDVLHRRGLITAVMLASVAMLFASSVAPSFAALAAFFIVVGTHYRFWTDHHPACR